MPVIPVAALGAAVLIWGTTFVVSSDALESASPAVLTKARGRDQVVVAPPLFGHDTADIPDRESGSPGRRASMPAPAGAAAVPTGPASP